MRGERQMRFDEARARRRLGVKAGLPHLLNGLKALNITLGYLLIRSIAGGWLNLPREPLLLLAIFAASFAGFSALDIAFKRDSHPQGEFVVQAGTLLFFGFIWLVFGR
jgi:hypothetical protein